MQKLETVKAFVELDFSERIQKARSFFLALDPRIPVGLILLTYLVLGMTVLGFNRSPIQALITTMSCVTLEVLMARIFNKKWILPWSALITSLSLSFLLNYSHDYYLLAIPVFFAIGSKYLFTFNAKHALNPAMAGVSLSLLFSHDLITTAPAYQWNGIGAMSLFIITLGLLFVIPKVPRAYLVFAFLITFTIQTALRAWIMKYHLPFETLFLGTLSSPSFFIFSFFMITDPATSPADKKQQVIVGVSLALVDLLLHLKQSYFTFFYAALIVGGIRFSWKHLVACYQEGVRFYIKERFFKSNYYLRPVLLLGVGFAATGVYDQVLRPHASFQKINWRLEEVSPKYSGLNSSERGDPLDLVDPRVQHVAKWILSNGESASVADFDNDGLTDLFLTNLLKKNTERSTLYKNVGSDRFSPFEIAALSEIRSDPKKFGIISNSVFVDYDNDGDQDLFLVVAFGRSRMLKNNLRETGRVNFTDVSDSVGLTENTNAIGATFADFNKDGLLDLIVLNVWPENLPSYETPQRLNIFNLPTEEFSGDNRPYDFMHDSWHMSNNGGVNLIYYQRPDHSFQKMDSLKMGMPETRWSLAVGVADFNHDGWPDIYIANDFGPDDLYYSQKGEKFENIKGSIFGAIGKDTYKGMNVSVADFDQTGWQDIYVSNVHHALQAEGSLYWKFSQSENLYRPNIDEKATQKSILNEERFGWGANAVDIDNDGRIDLAQSNGMVDDTFDKIQTTNDPKSSAERASKCPDYWYVNEKIARSPPSIHRYANKWGDIRGYCIYGKERNRIYLNRGVEAKPQFVDVASEVGITHLGSSRGVVSADFSNRGRRDLIFTYPFEAPKFYKNSYVGPKREEPQWVGFDLQSDNQNCNREAIGSTIKLEVHYDDGRIEQQFQEKQVVSGFSSQAEKRIHFGLGRGVQSVRAKLNWCYGVREVVLNDLGLNQYHKLRLENFHAEP